MVCAQCLINYCTSATILPITLLDKSKFHLTLSEQDTVEKNNNKKMGVSYLACPNYLKKM